MKSFLACVVALFVSTALLVPASAEEQGLASVLGDLSWGANKKDVLAYFKRVKDDEFREAAKATRDSIVKDKIRRKKRKELKEIGESFVALKGNRTPYDVSVISGEFQKNNGEALLRAHTEVAQKYFFFLDGKLWKMAVVYNRGYLSGIGFESFVDQVTGKYGEPDETEYDIKDESMTRAVWRDEQSVLRIDDKSAFYGTYTMVFANKAAVERVAKLRKAFGETTATSDISQDIKDIQEEDGFSSDQDVVDEIVGVSVEVNLEQGRPEGAELIRVGSGPTNSDGLGPEAAKKAKKRKVRKGRRKPKKKSKGDDLIIY